jgi:hypothetical protein
MHRRLIIAVLAASAALAGCSSIPDDPGPPPSAFEDPGVPTESPFGSPSPTPSQAGVPVTGCPTRAQVLTALTAAGAVEPDAPGLGLPDRPVCSGDWAGATVTAPDADPLGVLLERRKGRVYVLVAGTAVCEDPDAAGAPPAVRTALGC